MYNVETMGTFNTATITSQTLVSSHLATYHSLLYNCQCDHLSIFNSIFFWQRTVNFPIYIFCNLLSNKLNCHLNTYWPTGHEKSDYGLVTFSKIVSKTEIKVFPARDQLLRLREMSLYFVQDAEAEECVRLILFWLAVFLIISPSRVVTYWKI